MSEVDVNNSEITVPEVQQQESNDQSVKEAYAAFGLEYQQEELDGSQQEDQQFIDDGQEEESEDYVDDGGITEQPLNGSDYKKADEQARQYENVLNRLAKQHGLKDHAELVSNLDRIEQESIQRQQEQFEQYKKQMRDEAENAGLDPEAVEQYLENHPVLNQAKEVLERESQAQTIRKQEEEQQRQLQGWEDLFRKYPQLTEQTGDDGSAEWMTPEMERRIKRGYDPIDAYELVHRDSIIADERKRAEQSTLKQQRLNKRASVEKDTGGKLEPQAPAELTSAFAMFGINTKKAQKYAKNYE